jgi:hypothetical protein
LKEKQLPVSGAQAWLSDDLFAAERIISFLCKCGQAYCDSGGIMIQALRLLCVTWHMIFISIDDSIPFQPPLAPHDFTSNIHVQA